MTNWKTLSEADAGFVEILTNDRDGTPFGYRLRGNAAGPQLVVAGFCPMAMPIFDRLLSIPTLPWMRGTLVLVRLDILDECLQDLMRLDPLGPVDRTIILPWSHTDEPDTRTLLAQYHMVLRACADLGMISGRGVARQVPEHA